MSGAIPIRSSLFSLGNADFVKAILKSLNSAFFQITANYVNSPLPHPSANLCSLYFYLDIFTSGSGNFFINFNFVEATKYFDEDYLAKVFSQIFHGKCYMSVMVFPISLHIF